MPVYYDKSPTLNHAVFGKTKTAGRRLAVL
jgi:hypothetical protein